MKSFRIFAIAVSLFLTAGTALLNAGVFGYEKSPNWRRDIQGASRTFTASGTNLQGVRAEVFKKAQDWCRQNKSRMKAWELWYDYDPRSEPRMFTYSMQIIYE